MEVFVRKVRVLGDVVALRIEDEEGRKTFRVLLEDYLKHPFQPDQQLNEEEQEVLRQDSLYCNAYRRCLHKLSVRDYSEREMKRALREMKEITQAQRERIMETLKHSGYLNDENVAASQLYSDQNKLLGKRKTLYNLTGRGVDRQIAQQLIDEVDGGEELERGKQRAMKIWNRRDGKPYRQKMQNLRRQLMADGYEDIDEIISQLELTMDEEAESDNLSRDMAKAIRKYEKKHDGAQLKHQVIQYLLARGYSYEMIQQAYGREREEYENQ